MKAIRWIGWVALAALCMVPLVASPAWAAWSGTTAAMTQPSAKSTSPDSCDFLAWRGTPLDTNLAGPGDDVYKTRWYNYAGPGSKNMPILSFKIHNTSGAPDTLFSMYVHSLTERTNAISKIYLYKDALSDTAADPSHYFSLDDTLLQQLNVGTPFQTNDSILFTGLADVIPNGGTTWYHLVVDMNTAAITGNPTYNLTGVMAELRPNRVLLGQSSGRNYGPSAPVPDPAGTACTATSPANNAYSIIIDNQAPLCANFLLQVLHDVPCANSCDSGLTVISLGDSLLVRLDLDSTGTIATDSCVTGWPKIYLQEFTANPSPVSMGRVKGWPGWNNFVYTSDPDSTTGAPYIGFAVPLTGVSHPIDVNANFYYLVAETKDVAGNVGACSLLVANKIDTKKPAITLTHNFTLYYDANGNGIVNPGDTIRIFVDMSNEPFGEICPSGVTAVLRGWTGPDIPLTLNDNAGDRKFEVKYMVTPGILDTTAGALQDSVYVIVNDNACNKDSALVVLNNAVDNIRPTVSAWDRQFYRLLDADSNGCLMIGEKVRIRVANADINSDLTAIYANILSAGMGDSAGIVYSRHVLYNQGGGVWLLDWTLGANPQDSAKQAGSYQVWLYGVDDAGNYDSIATFPLATGLGNSTPYTMDTKYPLPVLNLRCQSAAHGVINLYWDANPGTPDADRYAIYFDNGTGTINYTTPLAMELNGSATSWTTDGTIVLTDGKIYKFDVWTRDHCGNWERVHPNPVACEADAFPAWVCVIQPDTGGVYCGNNPLTLYVCPDSTVDRDVESVTAWGRTANRGDGQPGEWHYLGVNQAAADNAVCFQINLNPDTLNYLVGTDTTKLIQVAITTVDDAGNVNTPDQAWAHLGCRPFHFYWTTETIAAQVSTINGTLPLLQPYCDQIGWTLSGSTNSVTTCLTDSGVGPYWVMAYLDCNVLKGSGKITAPHSISAASGVFPGPQLNGDEIFYGQGEPGCVTFNLDVSKLSKGPCRLEVIWIDVCGQRDSTYANLCIPDSIAPCAEVTNPVDGKCIRRSWSTADTLEHFQIDIKGNDLTPGGKGCIDQNNVLKVDFQWAKECCLPGSLLNCSTYSVKDSTPRTGGGTGGVCDTFLTGGRMDSIICTDTSFSGWKYFFHDTVLCKPCEASWNTFAIDSALDSIDQQGGHHHHGPRYYADWMNQIDLSWILKSGTNIFIRGVVYDDQGNIFYTQCVQVCVDIDTPPLCIGTNDLCGNNRISDRAKIFASLNFALDSIDDVEHIYLFTKKTDDPDIFSSWESWGDGDKATNSTLWTWDLNTNNHHNHYFQDQTYYDFRVIAKTTTGSWSYDYNGDGQFDAHTFDTTHCDAKTWLIDNAAPNIAIDTAWTTINGNTLVIPNSDCRLSDPKGYIWTQYGHSITVQPTVYPLGNIGDIVKTQWTLLDGSGHNGAECDCRGSSAHFDDNGANSYVFAVNQGTHAMDNLVFDPTKAPFVHVKNGYQRHVLHIQGWDACGNETEDCVEIYLLDVDTTEAIIINPMNDDVFCDQELADGGVVLTAATLLEANFKEAIFAYRPVGSTAWIPIDSVSSTHNGGTHHTMSVVWYPKALHLADGAYEVVVWAVDAAGNRQTNIYPITIHLSCAQPVVALTYPTTVSPKFLGCPLELTATASSSDPGNPITQVDFYVQSILEDEAHWIGSDDYTVDGTWSVHWNPKDTLAGNFHLTDGSYYLYATATNEAGLTTKSALVKVKYDGTAPWTNIIQVNGDRSDGGAADPTIVTAGASVPLYVLAGDDKSPRGYGLTDNCGLDSVVVYVSNDSTEAYPPNGKVIFASLMTPVDSLTSLYTVNWPTAGLPTGIYHVWSRAVDCACNSSSCNCNWYVQIGNPVPGATISVAEAVTICDTASVKNDSIHINVTPAANGDITEVQIWRENVTLSDVEDLWTLVGVTQTAVNGVFTIVTNVDSWPEGTYRLRAFYKSSSGIWIDDGNNDGKFDDFTFDPAHKPWQMWLKIDRTAPLFTVTLDSTMTLRSGRRINVIFTNGVPCDTGLICYGVVAENGDTTTAREGCVDSTHFSFNPVDSGLVSLNHGIFHGSIRITITDPLGNIRFVDEPLWILDMDSNQVRITSPLWGAYVTGIGDTLVKSVTARKLTSESIDSVVFFSDPTPAGAGTRFGKATSTVGSDEFMVDWNIKNVPEGDEYIWAVGYKGSTKLDNNPIKTWVIVVKTPKDIQLAVDTAHSVYYVRTVGPDKILFVGERADLGLNRDSISSIVSGVGIDSVVFFFRYADAPGGFPTIPDPAQGWVRIGVDRYGSLHTDWFTPKPDSSHGYHGHHGYHHGDTTCYDGQYAVAAWVYDKAGHVNHSNIVQVMVDNTKPYSEIVNIDGDEAFGTCHDITLTGTQTTVKFTAVAIDDRSCIGSTPAYNSGAKTLQFFVGHDDPSTDVGVIWGSDLVPLVDGQDNAFALWNPSGLKTGKYKVWTMVTDQLGNSDTSKAVKLCIYDKTPPVGFIAGFGVSTDEHMNHAYTIYGSSWDTDVDHVQFQYRSAASNNPTDWTGIGIPKGTTHHDPETWYTTWNPCTEVEGNYEFRMVPTDESGNENFDIQPILLVHVAACAVTPVDASVVGVGFEDRPDFTDLGTVNLTNAPTDKVTSMIAVYANLTGDPPQVEDIDLHEDVGDIEGQPKHFMASFDDGVIRKGGTGWFWAAYNDFSVTPKKTYLKKAEMKVYLVTDVGLPGTLTNTELGDHGTSVEIQPGALTHSNGVVMFPARDPTVWKNQLYLRAWPISSTSDMVTSIRLTDRGYAHPTGDTVSTQSGSWGDGGFNEGKYAKITISYYAPGVDSTKLAIAWWDGDKWVTNHGLLAGGQIQNGKATFFSDDLYGIYAVVSAGGLISQGAVDVEPTTFSPSVGSMTNAYPTFHTIVRSKLTGQQGNNDIDPSKIIVTVDGVTLFSGSDAATGWHGRWDDVSGLLELKPRSIPSCSDNYVNGYDSTSGSGKVTTLGGLASGSHMIIVQAFNKQGFYNIDTTTFTVDATAPKITLGDARSVCPNGTFHVTIDDNNGGAGVNWDSVFIDVHDFTASTTTTLPQNRLIGTFSKDNFTRDGNHLTFTVNGSFAEGNTLKLVIYDGARTLNTECGCVTYDHACDGVPDLVGNHDQIVEVIYTVDGTACTDTTGGTGVTVTPGGAGSNPFDPWTGGFISFNLNGFAAGGGQVSATVYDLTGEHVRGLNVGLSSAAWDGRDDKGDIVAEGVYLVHFQRSGGRALGGATSQVIKVVVKRK